MCLLSADRIAWAVSSSPRRPQGRLLPGLRHTQSTLPGGIYPSLACYACEDLSGVSPTVQLAKKVGAHVGSGRLLFSGMPTGSINSGFQASLTAANSPTRGN